MENSFRVTFNWWHDDKSVNVDVGLGHITGERNDDGRQTLLLLLAAVAATQSLITPQSTVQWKWSIATLNNEHTETPFSNHFSLSFTNRFSFHQTLSIKNLTFFFHPSVNLFTWLLINLQLIKFAVSYNVIYWFLCKY